MENVNHQQKQFVVAEIQLSYKSLVKPSLRPVIKGSSDANTILVQSWDPLKLDLIEQFKVLYLNRGNRVLGIFDLSTGGISATVADPKLIFVAALKAGASAIILSHNHPSGNLKPSQADIDLTRKIKEGGKYLEIQLLDHLIMTSEGYFSFADEGLL